MPKSLQLIEPDLVVLEEAVAKELVLQFRLPLGEADLDSVGWQWILDEGVLRLPKWVSGLPLDLVG
jgi:hypothetical protein